MQTCNLIRRVPIALLVLLAMQAVAKPASAQPFADANDWELVDLRRGEEGGDATIVVTTANMKTITSGSNHGTLADLQQGTSIRMAEYSTTIIPLGAVEWMKSHRRRLQLEPVRGEEDFVRAHLPIFLGAMPQGFYDHPHEFREEFRHATSAIVHTSHVDWFDCGNRKLASFRRFSGHGSDRLRWSRPGFVQNRIWERDEPEQYFSLVVPGDASEALVDEVCHQPVAQISYYETEREEPETPRTRNARRWISRLTYPSRSVESRQEGRTEVSMWVTAEGRAVQCQVTNSTASQILDKAACDHFERYARFESRVELLDTPLLPFSIVVNWQLPDEALATSEDD